MRESNRNNKNRGNSRQRSREKPHHRNNRDYHNEHRNRSQHDYDRNKDRRISQRRSRAGQRGHQQNDCPFLVRVIYSQKASTNFDNSDEQTKDNNELILYLRMSTTLIQVVELFRAHTPELRFKSKHIISKLHENLSNNNKSSPWSKQQIGIVMVDNKTLPQIVHLSNNFSRSNMGTNKNADVTLADVGFQIGDRIGICVLMNKYQREPLIS